MSGAGTDPTSPKYLPVKIVRQFSSTGSLVSQASSSSSSAEATPAECNIIEIKPTNCTNTYIKSVKYNVTELTSRQVKQEQSMTSPVEKVQVENTQTEAPCPAATNNLIDELFKEFLTIKMETIEAEYQDKQAKERQEKDSQQQLPMKDNTYNICTDGDECSDGVGDANRKRHHSKEKNHKSKHKDRSRLKSSRHRNERRSQHGSHVEENSKDRHGSLEHQDEETVRVLDAKKKSSQVDGPKETVGTDGVSDNIKNVLTKTNVQTDRSGPTSPSSDRKSVPCSAPNKHAIPIVRVVAVKGNKAGSGSSSRGTVLAESIHLKQEANARAEKEDSLWDIALSTKGDNVKSEKELPQSVFDNTGVKVKQHSGFKFGIKISEKNSDLISSQNKEEGEVSGSDSDSNNNEDGNTESVSGSDGEMKSAKQKKKKHRHKKRKKHKRNNGDRDGTSKRRHRSSSRSRTPKRYKYSRSRSRSTSRSHARKRGHSSRSKSRDQHRRSRSRDRDQHRYRSRSRSRGRHRSPPKGFYRGWRARSRSWSRSREGNAARKKSSDDLRVKIDKAKLRQIAIARAFNNMQTGQGPPVELKPDQLLALKAGGHSVQELTDFCKKISQKDKHRKSSSEDTSDSTPNEEEDETGPFIHHPFKLRDNQPNIVMNIANAKQLPILTPAMKASLGTELRVQFPVSSGSQHRVKEWVTVEKPKPAQAAAKALAMKSIKEDNSVFPGPCTQNISIGEVVSERLSALRRLQTNPNDVQALTKIYHVDQQMETWATSKKLPGQFTGSTDVHMLSQQELHGGYQAWIKKDQFAKAAPVQGGIGMSLLQKMGWKQGEGLGKDNKGSLEPLALSVKMDRKGLSSQGENIKKVIPVPTRKDLSGKHPISALVELCNKKKWGPPDFVVVNETGPDHKKNFIIKVQVKGMEYQPTVSSASKKLAKAQAATVCLQQLGLIPQ